MTSPKWEPEVLQLPLERPMPRTPPRWLPELAEAEEAPRRDGEHAGSHVIVIDIA